MWLLDGLGGWMWLCAAVFWGAAIIVGVWWVNQLW